MSRCVFEQYFQETSKATAGVISTQRPFPHVLVGHGTIISNLTAALISYWRWREVHAIASLLSFRRRRSNLAGRQHGVPRASVVRPDGRPCRSPGAWLPSLHLAVTVGAIAQPMIPPVALPMQDLAILDANMPP